MKECSTHNSVLVPDKVKTVFIPKCAFGTLNSLFSQCNEYLTQITNVDVAPNALSLSNLDSFTGLNGDSSKLGNLIASGLDRTISLAINDGRKYQSCFDALNPLQVVIYHAGVCVCRNYLAKLGSILNVVERLPRLLTKALVHDIRDGEDASTRNLDPITWKTN